MPVIDDKKRRIFFFESLGVLIFTYGIGCAGLVNKDDIVAPPDGVIVACSLLAGLVLCAEITDGYLNPILAIASHINKPSKYTWIYILGQFAGGLLGTILFYLVNGSPMIPVVDDEYGIVDKQIIKYGVNQFVGSFFFAIMVLVVTNHKTSFATKSWQMYLSIIVSLFLVRKMTGQTAINPGIAVPAQLFASLIDSDHANAVKSLLVLVPSILGSLLAGLIMKKLYEPLLLFKNYKAQIQSMEQQQNAEN